MLARSPSAGDLAGRARPADLALARLPGEPSGCRRRGGGWHIECWSSRLSRCRLAGRRSDLIFPHHDMSAAMRPRCQDLLAGVYSHTMVAYQAKRASPRQPRAGVLARGRHGIRAPSAWPSWLTSTARTGVADAELSGAGNPTGEVSAFRAQAAQARQTPPRWRQVGPHRRPRHPARWPSWMPPRSIR
jgi:hypothetical protein